MPMANDMRSLAYLLPLALPNWTIIATSSEVMSAWHLHA